MDAVKAICSITGPSKVIIAHANVYKTYSEIDTQIDKTKQWMDKEAGRVGLWMDAVVFTQI